jgi:hypothetical protein
MAVDDQPQVPCDRRLQRQQPERVVLAPHPQRVDLPVTGDDLLRQVEVGLQQRPGGPLHGIAGQPAHGGQLGPELLQLAVEYLAHGRRVWPATGRWRCYPRWASA